MIVIKTIKIEEFRGIRELDLDLQSENFGICGPNGTGKSGIVDAIEFCLTGNITRLSGQGQGELSVKRHAPHVDHRMKPDKAKVTINATVPSLKKDIVVSRTVKNPGAVEITPTETAVEAIISEVQTHPEFALSRREIAKYIVTPPAHRSTDVQNLLRLEQIGGLRKVFVTYANKRKSAADEAERARLRAENELKTALNLKSLDRKKVLEKANEHRKVLGLPDLTELSPQTSFKAASGKDTKEPKDAEDKKGDKQPGISKTVALADLTALSNAIKSGEPAIIGLTYHESLNRYCNP